MNRTIWLLRLTGLSTLLFLVVLPFTSFAQDQEPTPVGEGISQEIHTGPLSSFQVNSRMLKARYFLRKPLEWSPPKGQDITQFSPKFMSFGSIVFIGLSDGSVYEMILTDPYGWDIPTLRSPPGGPNFNKLVGDALYGLSSSDGITYVSRDTAATWLIDTAGLGSGYPHDLSLDSLQYVYLAYSSGLFKQSPDNSTWQKVSSFPGTNTSAVFVDRMNRVFAASSRNVYMSTNSGATWKLIRRECLSLAILDQRDFATTPSETSMLATHSDYFGPLEERNRGYESTSL